MAPVRKLVIKGSEVSAAGQPAAKPNASAKTKRAPKSKAKFKAPVVASASIATLLQASAAPSAPAVAPAPNTTLADTITHESIEANATHFGRTMDQIKVAPSGKLLDLDNHPMLDDDFNSQPIPDALLFVYNTVFFPNYVDGVFPQTCALSHSVDELRWDDEFSANGVVDLKSTSMDKSCPTLAQKMRIDEVESRFTQRRAICIQHDFCQRFTPCKRTDTNDPDRDRALQCIMRQKTAEMRKEPFPGAKFSPTYMIDCGSRSPVVSAKHPVWLVTHRGIFIKTTITKVSELHLYYQKHMVGKAEYMKYYGKDENRDAYLWEFAKVEQLRPPLIIPRKKGQQKFVSFDLRRAMRLDSVVALAPEIYPSPVTEIDQDDQDASNRDAELLDSIPLTSSEDYYTYAIYL